MALPRLRGIARRTGAALVAASVVCVGGLATPAHAATRSVVSVLAPDTQILLPRSEGGAAADFRTITPLILDEGPDTATGVKLVIDASKLAHVAELSLPKGCSFSASDPAHLHAVCSLGSVELLDSVDLGIRADAGAAEGATGSIVFSLTATNGSEDPEDAREKTGTTRVTLGHGPDLAAGSLGDLKVSPGSTEDYSPQVTNQGDRDVTGVVMYLDAQQLDGAVGLSLTGPSHSNCLYHYGDPDDTVGDRTGVYCTFPDVVVHPGETYRVSTPVGLTASADASEGFFEYGFDLVGGQLADSGGTGTKGSGPALGLTLVPAPTKAARTQVEDIDYSNNIGLSLVSTGRVEDVAATAGDVTGTVGKRVGFHASVVNTGTVATVPIPGAPSADVTAAEAVFFPSGVTVTSAPASCSGADDADDAVGSDTAGVVGKGLFRTEVRKAEDGLPEADGPLYLCLVQKVLQPGQSATFDFTVKPTKVLHKAEGGVVAVSGGSGIDDNPVNNIADFTVSAVAAAGTPTPRPTATATASSAPAASGGGGLAATGGGGDALPVSLAGVAAILLGAGGVLFARRRRNGSHG